MALARSPAEDGSAPLLRVNSLVSGGSSYSCLPRSLQALIAGYHTYPNPAPQNLRDPEGLSMRMHSYFPGQLTSCCARQPAAKCHPLVHPCLSCSVLTENSGLNGILSITSATRKPATHAPLTAQSLVEALIRDAH